MKNRKLWLVTAYASILVIPAAKADTWSQFPSPTPTYLLDVINYGGGNDSGSTISSLGPFSFTAGAFCLCSGPLSFTEGYSSAWGSPESSATNMLYTSDNATIMTIAPGHNLVGFDMAPYLTDSQMADAPPFVTVNIEVFNQLGQALFETNLYPASTDGAAFFNVLDTTPGNSIGEIIFDPQENSPYGLEFANLSAGIVAISGNGEGGGDSGGGGPTPTPEPSSLLLVGSGIVLALGARLRRPRSH